MRRLGSEISRLHPCLKQWVGQQTRDQDTLAPVSSVLRSPLLQGYRNKCEFSVGRGSDGQVILCTAFQIVIQLQSGVCGVPAGELQGGQCGDSQSSGARDPGHHPAPHL